MSPERSLKFRDDIQGLRALAVLSVLAFHMDRNWLPGGFVGVDIFYVISGFLISRIIFAECAEERFSLQRFYERRAKRILPAMLVVVAFVGIYGWLFSDPAQFKETGAHMMGNSYFTVNFWLLRQATEGYFAQGSNAKILLHLWSLSIEEQFYLVWAALMLLLYKLRCAAIGPTIALILIASFAYGVWLTSINPVEAFYLPWTRAWELAIGAALAYREVFMIEALPHPGRGAANLGAGSGIVLMLAALIVLNETQPFPGWRAAIPTLGCALVVASPGSTWATLALRNPIASAFGLISYPLYLWHWPLLAYARSTPGVPPTTMMTLGLGALAVMLAALTVRFIERPIDAPFRRHPRLMALGLVGLLALTGLAGRQIYANDGYPGRFPAEVTKIFTFAQGGLGSGRLLGCLYDGDKGARLTMPEMRERAKAFFTSHDCLKREDPLKPTIMVVGDSHAGHLFGGLEKAYAGKANILALTATYCLPVMEFVRIGQGEAATPRCQAINSYVFQQIRAIKPDVLLIGGFFDTYLRDRSFRYPAYAENLASTLRGLHEEGVPAIVVAGQVPTWNPWMRILVGREVLDHGKASEFSTAGLMAGSLETDGVLKAQNWGPGVSYVSQADALCGVGGCRRLVGPAPPEDMLAIDYGHYTAKGSVFAVGTILAPAIDRALAGRVR